MPKFKVGDTIVRISNPGTVILPIGTIVIVSYVSKCGNSIQIEGNGYSYSPFYFELYKEPVMTNETKKPHVHAECIKAWADGAKIEFRFGGECKWRDLKTTCPSWNESVQYRIKPEPAPDVVNYGLAEESNPCITLVSYRHQAHYHNLKLIFDGETGKLKDAKVIG